MENNVRISVKIDTDDDFWYVSNDVRQRPSAFPKVFKNRRSFQKWIEDNMANIKINYCASYNGKVSDFASYGRRVKAVMAMFDEAYALLTTSNLGCVQHGNWSIKWEEAK